MAERSNAAVLKTVIPSDRDRGFESHSLLHVYVYDYVGLTPVFLKETLGESELHKHNT